MSKIESTYTDLCEEARLNVRGVAQTANHVLVAVGPDRRDPATVIKRMRKLAGRIAVLTRAGEFDRAARVWPEAQQRRGNPPC